MKLVQILLAFDTVHSRRRNGNLEPRALYGSVFGIDLPAWVIFHSMLGYVLLGIGSLALILRLPLKLTRRKRWLHPYLGYTFIWGTVWMPITSIWCVYVKMEWDLVAFFIFSMYASIQAGWACARVFRYYRGQSEDLASSGTGSIKTSAKRQIYLKWAHAAFMIWSFVMLLGAGISFPLRGQINDNYSAKVDQ